jgi:DNA polymerase
MFDLQLDLFSTDKKTPLPANFDKIPTSADIPIPAGTYQNIEELSTHCRSCTRCELAASRTNVVIGKGNPQAPIVIIGEGPGQQEDEQGLPFVGRSGQLLDNILKSVELTLEKDVYITNAVRCRPPNNRTPHPEEMAACKPFLLEHIRLVNPQIILLTGATAVKSILAKKEGITKIRGQWFEWENRACMPIFHPAYLLRNASRAVGSPKWLMWQDIQSVKDKLAELTRK